MQQEVFIVDAFTSSAYGGNPASVCLLSSTEKLACDEVLQNIAMEMHHSETAFLALSSPLLENHYDLRWFTPTVEIDLCGHATMASAHMLWESGAANPSQDIQFHISGGRVLHARRVLNSESGSASGALGAVPDELPGLIELDFPVELASAVAGPDAVERDGHADWVSARECFPECLAAHPDAIVEVGRNRMDVVIEVTPAAFAALGAPDLTRMKQMPHRVVIVTCRADWGANREQAADFLSRAFAPGVGVDEDPVCGSAHCALGPWWLARGICPDEECGGQIYMRAKQMSQRGGSLLVRVHGDRCFLAGRAVTTLQGSLKHTW